ncbi:MAG: squalene/phytoene synthase family protein [Candidatus Kapabacteria bacterium]|nr:squalene/phytoene synthase family protein [Candidatus Kapabacteria bacterium]
MDSITQAEFAIYENIQPSRYERSNFAYSFSFLPKEERSAINVIYAFCSYIDDIVDGIPNLDDLVRQKKKQRLAWWENEIEKIYSGTLKNPLISPFINVINRFNIPKQYFLTLIDGCRRDLLQQRYNTFEELKEYLYSVASVVGLISIEIFGYRYEETQNYAINLGYALQLTNILRDIKADKDRGFIYLPQEDLERFKYTEQDLINEVYDDRFIDLMRFEVQRCRQYYHKARTMLHPDEKMTVIPAEIMDSIYYRLLEKIELNDFNVFKKKIRVNNLHKFMIATKHWLSMRVFVKRLKD